ncbi:unnamed protein product [Prorocentrum cordatum]|uniref:Uncharacterized protein n=1 Tax=Prorocentrum cordatum TaxID=2364126 RepID=A0ABN9RSE0_9DINO|nr:unnamed protein product [Polarella glacialis]
MAPRGGGEDEPGLGQAQRGSAAAGPGEGSPERERSRSRSSSARAGVPPRERSRSRDGRDAAAPLRGLGEEPQERGGSGSRSRSSCRARGPPRGRSRSRGGDGTAAAGRPGSRGPPALQVQFAWAAQLFQRTEVLSFGRHVYRTRGSLDGLGGLTLSYSMRQGGSWELGSPSGGCLYHFRSDAETPTVLVGCHPWSRVPSGVCHITVGQRAEVEELCGWVDPGLFALEPERGV